MKKITLSKGIIYIVLTIIAVLYVAPLVWIVLVSFKTNAEVFSNPFGLPQVWQLGNYIFAWTKGKLGIALWNSVFVCVFTLAVSLLLGAMAAFGIARMRFGFNNATLTYFMIGMMVPVHCVLIPLFVMFSKMKIKTPLFEIRFTNSLIGIIIPYITFALPMTIFILVGFFRSMPGELFEAACIDGCSIYKIFFSIALPLSKTGIFVTGMMSFVNTWNELLVSMVFISDPEKKTLPVTLTYFVGPYATNYVQMFAAIVIAVVPTIIVYSIFSNQIVEGLTAGAVKG
ncbi:MAG: carbohydrate ABC transporter permease [Butyrivibrio sp.]|jgi:raffinose/stachyose/melibiose transport system permease protein|nr:carbohydrate ABC transporter permease [Butyrivibrio sp.]